MSPVISAVTDRVHFAWTPLVNWTLVTSDDGVMLIDAGYPGSRDDVIASLDRLGCHPADVTAILLTHAHIDHLGTAIWFAKTHHTPVYCHANEVGHAKRDYLQQISPMELLPHIWRPRWLRWSLDVVAKGGLVRDGIPTTRALTDDVAATLPGHPRALPTPGHTAGHCSYLVDGVLVAGDALVTGHPLLTGRGPQLLPALANLDEAQCVRSLEVLVAAGTDVLLPGHGEIWTGPISEAVRRVTVAGHGQHPG